MNTVYIRPATKLDRQSCRELIRAFLVEMRENGSEALPTKRTIDFYMGIFDDYMRGRIPGIVVVASDLSGISMTGHVHPIETTYGRTATGWLTYVRPESRGKGIGSSLRSHLRCSLRSLGFQSIAAGYHQWNTHSRTLAEQRGFKSVQLYGYESLSEGAD